MVKNLLAFVKCLPKIMPVNHSNKAVKETKNKNRATVNTVCVFFCGCRCVFFFAFFMAFAPANRGAACDFDFLFSLVEGDNTDTGFCHSTNLAMDSLRLLQERESNSLQDLQTLCDDISSLPQSSAASISSRSKGSSKKSVGTKRKKVEPSEEEKNKNKKKKEERDY